MKKIILLGLLAGSILTACTAGTEMIPATETQRSSGGMGMGMGQMGGMMQRHHATIPDEYTDVSAPESSEESIERGAELYATHCATCHGGSGMGDGPAGVALDPSPAPIAHTSQQMTDAYLYWRISEGGVPFDTAMPAWKDTLDEQARWDVIHYVQALGRGEAEPVSDNGQTYDPSFAATQQAEMLVLAVEAGVITEDEATLFREVHATLETYLTSHAAELSDLDMVERERTALEALVESGELSQAQVDEFNDIHTRLTQSGE